MLCRRCRKNEAEFVIKAAIKNKLTRLMLCPKCLSLKEKELGLGKGTLSYYAVPLRGAAYAQAAPVSGRDARLKCPFCTLAYGEFRETGLLGCPHCYDAFRPQLEYFVRHMTGFSRHAGRAPAAADGELKLKAIKFDSASLQAGIKSAVAREDFEKAARLRDILKSSAKKRRRAS
jgi:protein arginine kinase activator